MKNKISFWEFLGLLPIIIPACIMLNCLYKGFLLKDIDYFLGSFACLWMVVLLSIVQVTLSYKLYFAGNYLCVRNKYRYKYFRKFPLKEIKEVVFDKVPRTGGPTITIHLKDNSIKSFQIHNYLELRNEFRLKRIWIYDKFEWKSSSCVERKEVLRKEQWEYKHIDSKKINKYASTYHSNCTNNDCKGTLNRKTGIQAIPVSNNQRKHPLTIFSGNDLFEKRIFVESATRKYTKDKFHVVLDFKDELKIKGELHLTAVCLNKNNEYIIEDSTQVRLSKQHSNSKAKCSFKFLPSDFDGYLVLWNSTAIMPEFDRGCIGYKVKHKFIADLFVGL